MANISLSDKAKRASLERGLYCRNRDIDERAANAAPRKMAKPRNRIDPKERGWAHAYLKHVAQLKGLPYQSVRESMQLIGTYFGIEIPSTDESASRSATAISLAKAIYAKTGILLPRHQ